MVSACPCPENPDALRWFDSHSHLHDPAFVGDLPQVAERAVKAGVEAVLLPASSAPDSVLALRLILQIEGAPRTLIAACDALAPSLPTFELETPGTFQSPHLYASIGVHPHEAASLRAHDRTLFERLLELAAQAERALGRDRIIRAVGEIGLDYHYMYSPKEAQADAFRRQLEWARDFDLPVIIHTREATADTLAILREAETDGLLAAPEGCPPGVIHCYSGSAESTRDYLALGFMLGFDGPVTFKNARVPKAALIATPSERLVIETDAPYLTPVPYRGRRNEPSLLPHIGRKASELRSVTTAEMAALTRDNARRLFRIDG